MNIAKLVPLMGEPPDGAGEIMAKLEAAANQARDQLKQAQLAFEQRNVNLAENLVSQDDVIDAPQPPDLPGGGRDRRQRPRTRASGARTRC